MVIRAPGGEQFEIIAIYTFKDGLIARVDFAKYHHVAAPPCPARDQPASFAFTAENAAWAQDDDREISAGPPGVRGDLAAVARPGAGRLGHAADDRERRARCSTCPSSACSKSRPSTRCSIWSRSGKYLVQVCTTTPCWLRGSDDVVAACKKHIASAAAHVSADGKFSWMEVECLGACVNAPMLQIGKDFYEDLDGPNTEKLIEAFRRGETSRKARSADRAAHQLRARSGGARIRSPIVPPTPRIAGSSLMLADKDRIFTNLYGFQDSGLEGARRSAARGTAPRRSSSCGPEAIVDDDEEVGPARPRRRGLSDRPQMVLHAQGSEGAAALSRRQCRRIRARHLQGPRHHAPRSAHAGRRLPDRQLRDARACLLHLCPRRIHPRARGAAARDRRGLCRQADRQEQHPRLGFRSLSSITAPAPISAARKPRCSKASKARRASRA